MEHNNLLTEIGFSLKENQLYQLLLKVGESPAKTIILDSGLPRGTVYEILSQLEKKGLVEKFDHKKIARFRAKHPFALKTYLENESARISQSEKKLESILPDLISQYNLAQNRPGVKFYEGKEGIKKVLWDSLESNTEIYTLADFAIIGKYIRDLDNAYYKERLKKGINKKIIAVNTRENQNVFKEEIDFTEVKLSNLEIDPFNSNVQIYDNKVAYMTLTDKFMTGTIINDPYVYAMNKALFKFIWDKI